MKHDLKTLCWLNLAILLFLVYLSSDLIALLYDKPMTSGGITMAEFDQNFNNSSADHNSQRIPKIIHQTYKTEECPPIWQEAQQSIKDQHPDYQYILWTDTMARDFIATQYSWFLKTFDGYRHPIMRADAIRYFVLYHYGGIYIDLDNGAKQPLDSLLNTAAFLRKTHPTGVSNDIMASVPGHPLFGQLIDSLEHYNRNWLVPYITVMFSTGPLFVSVVMRKFLRSHGGINDPDRVRILMPSSSASSGYKPVTDFFFTVRGSSWHQNDAQSIMFMLHHWVAFVFIYTLLGFSLLLLAVWIEIKLIDITVAVSRAVGLRLVSAGLIQKTTLCSFFGCRQRASQVSDYASPDGASELCYSRRGSAEWGSRGDHDALLDDFKKMDISDMV